MAVDMRTEQGTYREEDIYRQPGMPRSGLRHRPVSPNEKVTVLTPRASRSHTQEGPYGDKRPQTGRSRQGHGRHTDPQRQTYPAPRTNRRADTQQGPYGDEAYQEDPYENEEYQDDRSRRERVVRRTDPHPRQAHLHAVPKSTSQAKGSKIWIVWLIVGALVAFLLLQLGFFLWSWGTDVVNTYNYGPTRTSVVSGVFGHNGDSSVHPTEVIAMNLQGTLLLEEVPAGDVSKTKPYPTNVTLIGGDAASKIPVTLSIMPGSNQHPPNVLIQIAGQNIALKLVNNGDSFTLTTS